MIVTKSEAIRLCMRFGEVYEDYPFDANWAVIRHKANRKSFAFVFERDATIWINLKVNSENIAVYCKKYACVLPAYHMNKKHWISVILDGSMADDDLKALVEESYALTKPKR